MPFPLWKYNLQKAAKRFDEELRKKRARKMEEIKMNEVILDSVRFIAFCFFLILLHYGFGKWYVGGYDKVRNTGGD